MDGANSQMLKTVGLIVAAILIGVVLLNVVDDGTAKTAKPGTTTPTKAKPNRGTTDGSVPDKTTSTTATSNTNPKKPAEIKVIVLNGSGVTKVAGNMAKAIKAKGYTNQLPADTLAATRTGSAVQCRAGLETEAKALAVQVANKAKVEPFPATLPKLAKQTAKVDATVQCIVIIGK